MRDCHQLPARQSAFSHLTLNDAHQFGNLHRPTASHDTPPDRKTCDAHGHLGVIREYLRLKFAEDGQVGVEEPKPFGEQVPIRGAGCD